MEVCDDPKTKSWLGTSISDMCKGSPWSFSVSPIHVSKYHAVLYNQPVNLKSPPLPHCSSQPHHWDEDHVRMPYSEKNLFPVKEVILKISSMFIFEQFMIVEWSGCN